MNILHNTMCLLLSRYLALPLNVVTGILLARVLGPEELGRYALMVWLPSVLAGPMSLGLGNANLYFGARDRGLGPSLVANSFAVSLGFFFHCYMLTMRLFKNSGLRVSPRADNNALCSAIARPPISACDNVRHEFAQRLGGSRAL